MIDITENPKVTALVARIEAIARAAGSREADQRLAQLYLEVGHYVHWLLRQEPAAQRRVALEGQRWVRELAAHDLTPEMAEADELHPIRVEDLPIPELRWSPGEVERSMDTSRFAVHVERSMEVAGGELVEIEELVTDGLMEVEPDALLEPLSASVEGVAEVLEVEPLAEEDDITDSVAAMAAMPSEHGWMRSMRDLIEVLGPPERGSMTPEQCQQAANRLLNATTQMEERWIGYPDSAQHALTGYVAARCRALQGRMPVDVELKMVLGRLRRFHAARRLPMVAGLDDRAKSEGASWDADAARWWDMLRRGA